MPIKAPPPEPERTTTPAALPACAFPPLSYYHCTLLMLSQTNFSPIAGCSAPASCDTSPVSGPIASCRYRIGYDSLVLASADIILGLNWLHERDIVHRGPIARCRSTTRRRTTGLGLLALWSLRCSCMRNNSLPQFHRIWRSWHEKIQEEMQEHGRARGAASTYHGPHAASCSCRAVHGPRSEMQDDEAATSLAELGGCGEPGAACDHPAGHFPRGAACTSPVARASRSPIPLKAPNPAGKCASSLRTSMTFRRSSSPRPACCVRQAYFYPHPALDAMI
ncbi:hypothetical protein LXA43DRAFT_1082086 [Ganoderma leucocontextum]|nr:hypothetical protein LXA43DRAFT_1082086 [Ganoderma leucocontextum]